MSKLFIFVLWSILGLCIGIGLAILTLFAIAHAPLSVEDPLLSTVGITKHRIIGFLPYWLTTKASDSEDKYITTLDYFSFTIGTDGHIVKLASPGQEEPGWYDLQTPAVQKKLTNAKNNNITLSLTVSQADEDSITALLASPTQHAQNLLSDVVPIMKKYQFTDLNVDIESFQNADSKKEQQFTTFVQIIKNSLQKQHLGSVTIDIAPIAFVKPYLINPIKVGKIVDYMLVMEYDFHTVVSSNTGPIAPLHGIGKETEYDSATSIAIAKSEINPSKIIYGIPLYGYEWDTLENFPGSATIPNSGETASSMRASNILTTCATCVITQDVLAQEPDTIFQDKKGDPYFHQIFVFDSKALATRVTFSKENKFAGVALWALGYESNTLLQPLAAYKNNFSFQ